MEDLPKKGLREAIKQIIPNLRNPDPPMSTWEFYLVIQNEVFFIGNMIFNCHNPLTFYAKNHAIS